MCKAMKQLLMEFLIYASYWKDIMNKKYKLYCLALKSLQNLAHLCIQLPNIS